MAARKSAVSSSSTLFGCPVRSDLPLPELAWPEVYAELLSPRAGQPVAEPIQVLLSEYAGGAAAEPWFRVAEDGVASLELRHVVRLTMARGTTIKIAQQPGADEAMIRLYLLGSAMGCILHQRGLIPLHISAVVINGRAWGFTADSGTGKSTLAARLHRFAGCPMVADDVAALHVVDGRPFVAGGPPLMKLAPEFAACFPGARLEPVPHPESDKIKVQVRRSFVPGLVPLAGIVVLERDADMDEGGLEIERLSGSVAFLAAREAIYRYQMGLAMSSPVHMFQQLTALAQHVPFYRGRLGPWRVAVGGNTEPAIVDRLGEVSHRRHGG